MNKTVISQCVECNPFDEGNVPSIRRADKKIGEEATDMLEIKKHNVCKMSEVELDILIDHYTKKLKKICLNT